MRLHQSIGSQRVLPSLVSSLILLVGLSVPGYIKVLGAEKHISSLLCAQYTF